MTATADPDSVLAGALARARELTGMDLEFVGDRAVAVHEGEIRRSGLGLSVSGSIVAAHGSTMALGSEDGAGSTVRVRLPLPRR